MDFALHFGIVIKIIQLLEANSEFIEEINKTTPQLSFVSTIILNPDIDPALLMLDFFVKLFHILILFPDIQRTETSIFISIFDFPFFNCLIQN